MTKKNNRLISIAEEAKIWRQAMHQHPQTSYEEHFASDLVADKLKNFGVDEIHRGIAVTGIVAVIKGNRPGLGIGLRADMDALDIHEENTFDHASQITGKMHACGHDGHTATLLGAAQYLSEHRDFAGTVYCIFQPAEEGGAGADKMIAEGLFERFSIDTVWGLHNMPGLPLGQVEVCAGGFMASVDTFEVTFTGRGAHAAYPHEGSDQILAACQCVSHLQQISSRQTDPLDSIVVSVTMFHAGSANNILPTTAKITGSLRALKEDTRTAAKNAISDIAQSVAGMHGAAAEISFCTDSYPVTVNTETETARAVEVAQEVFGTDAVNSKAAPSMASEDFAFMLQHRPGCYIMLGNGDTAPVHTPNYDFNDAALIDGMRYWIALVQRVTSSC